jgi:hypothetical protein
LIIIDKQLPKGNVIPVETINQIIEFYRHYSKNSLQLYLHSEFFENLSEQLKHKLVD